MDETELKKRGRPKKVAPPEINEISEKLNMSQNISNNSDISHVNECLTQYYNKALGIGSNPIWVSASNTLQSNNPFLQNQRLKTISDIPGVMSGEELASALSAPQNSEIPLRRQGWALSASQYIYYKILRMAADVPLFKYYKTPVLSDIDFTSKSFIEEDKFVDEWLKKFDLVNTLKKVSLEVKREGKCVYVLRNSTQTSSSGKHVNYCTWQKLPSNYVKLTGIGEHGYIASFNMLLFLNPAFNIDQYPDFMREIWYNMVQYGVISDNIINSNSDSVLNNRLRGYSQGNKMQDADGNKFSSKYNLDVDKLITFAKEYGKNNCGILESSKKTYMFWVQLPQELCYVFSSDTSHAWAVPDTIGLFTELQNLTDFDTLSGLIASTPLTAMLTAEVPLIADSNLNAGQDQTALSPDTIMGYQNKFTDAVSSNIDAYIAPFKNMKLQSLPNVPNSSDISSKATQNFVTKSGMGGLLVTTDKPSVSMVKAAQLLYEAECNFLTKQFESVLNMIINKLIGCEYEWKLHIWGGIYSFSDEVKRDKELFVSGASFVLPKLASAYDMSLRDVKATGNYIDSLDLYKYFQTVTQATQAEINSGSSGNSIGRPTVDEEDIDNDNTAASKESGLDTADMRDFALKCAEDGKCIIRGQDSDSLT